MKTLAPLLSIPSRAFVASLCGLCGLNVLVAVLTAGFVVSGASLSVCGIVAGLNLLSALSVVLLAHVACRGL